jgi:hypothetical protein
MTRRQSLFLASCSHCFWQHVDNSAKNGVPGNENLAAALLPLERVFDAADSILDLSCRLVGLTFGLQLGITENLAGNLLGFAFDLLRRSLDPIFVHNLFSKSSAARDGRVHTTAFR